MSDTTQNFSIGEIPRNGGWRGSPNSLAALARYRVLYLRDADASQRCRQCRQVAMRGIDLCAMHARTRTRKPGHGHGERRHLAALERRGLLPLELIALPLWRNLAGLPTAQRAPMRLALVNAWDRRYSAPLHWAEIQRRAIDLGATPGRRQNTAPWYENR